MKVRKLTPSVLKRIIKEEKAKISGNKKLPSKKSSNTIIKKVDEIEALALQEARLLRAVKKLRNRRKSIKSSLRNSNNKR